MGAAPMTMLEAAESTSPQVATRKHIRGSGLLLFGRLFALATNFLAQVMIVRYLAKSDYGSFAYALSIAMTTSNVLLAGLHKAIPRFVPIYLEKRDHRSMFGVMALSFGTVLGLGLTLIVLVLALRGVLASRVVTDPLSLKLLLILIAISPMQAWDNLLQGVVATFVGARAVFFRRHILAPCLRVAAIVVVILAGGNVQLLAICYVAATLLGVATYCAVLRQVLIRMNLLSQFRLRQLVFHTREIFSFSIPLISGDILLVLSTTLAVVLLEHVKGPLDVAEFRAVMPVANLGLIVFESLKLLFAPAASRLFARNDTSGISALHWQSTLWMIIATFPISAVCVFLAKPVTILLFGERYAHASILLAILATSCFADAVFGLSRYTLQVFAKVRFLATVNLSTALVGLLLNLLLIPRYGAVGAAIALASASVMQNVLIHLGLARVGIEVLPSHRRGVFVSFLAAIALLLLLASMRLPTVLMAIVIVAVSLTLVRVNRKSLDIVHTFPELARVPGVARVFG